MATNPEDWNFPGGADCRYCEQRVEVRAFPAIERDIRGDKPEAILGADEASCYYHAGHRATVHCDACGRFLCALCDLPLDGQHLCPSCVESGVKSNRLAAADTHRTLFDSVALAFATWPILIFYLTVFTAPVSLYFVFRYWKTPQGILPRSRWRFVLAAILATAQLVGMVKLIIGVLAVLRRGGTVD